MQKVSNKKCIRRLSLKTLKTAKVRNIIAVVAIMLTTILFTSLFTIAMSINKSFEEQNFRQIGGYAHGGFKYVTFEQMEELKKDPLLRESGGRLMLGMPIEAPFHKTHVEISYMEENCAKYSFCIPEVGRLPKEGTMEAAADTRVLELLGVEPKLGEEFTITYNIGIYTEKPQSVTQTFILSGWWENDEASSASNVLVPLSRAKEVLSSYEPQSDKDFTGRWDLNVMFKNTLQIRENLVKILENHGYQSQDQGKDNYINIGVNWGYSGAQFSQNVDIGTILGIILALLLIVFSGYLIINNIFRISVTGDIRYYGLLKTIGTTGKQIRRIIRRQAILLSGIGIPLGILFGWIVGAKLTPLIMKTLVYQNTVISVHPFIFLFAALFSFITVLLSCRKPAKIAAKVSPVEAVRYSESQSVKTKEKHGEHGGKAFRMALANLGRNKSKTILVIISLSLAVMLLNATYTFTNGFDMDKYLEKWVSTDFIFGSVDYFRSQFGNESQAVSEDMISRINEQEGITDKGRIYGQTTLIEQFVSEDYVRKEYRSYFSSEMELDTYIEALERNEKGQFEGRVDLYGMEELPVSKLTTIEGDLSKLSEEGQIAAIVFTDDYGRPEEDSNHYKIGDQVEILYVDEFDYIDSTTGELATENTPEENFKMRYIKTHKKTYTVCARVTMRNSMGYRFYGGEQMVLPAAEFVKQTGTNAIMTYLFDTTKESNADIEKFLEDYTSQVETAYDFESKQSYIDEFNGFRNMFVLMGTTLSFIIGMIGVLNFINAIVTSVISRKREFAILQAVGMTGKQMKRILILEGCIYGICAILIAFLLNLILAPSISNVLSSMFWFYNYHFTILPILCILPIFLAFGIVIPLVVYRVMVKQTLVDRIRDSEV